MMHNFELASTTEEQLQNKLARCRRMRYYSLWLISGWLYLLMPWTKLRISKINAMIYHIEIYKKKKKLKSAGQNI